MNKLRIGILSPIHWRTPPRGYGPWEQVASDIAEELVRRGHDVTLYATGDSITKAKLKSVAPNPLLESSGQHLENKLYGQLHAALPFEDAAQLDIIHNHYDGYPLVMSRLVDIPVVTTVHGFSSPQIHRLYKKYDNVHYVSISHSDRKNCPDLNWVANVYHGLDISRWPFNDKPEDWLGSIGRIHPSKGVDIAIEVAKRAGMKLKIAGGVDENDPVSRKYWAEKIKPHIDGKQIVYVGELDCVKKVGFFQKAKAILAPVQWEEPFGLVLIESMAVGTPVIGFDRGSLPEVVQDGVGGFVVPDGDIDKMVKAVKKIDTISRAGVRAHAEANYTIGKMVDQYEKLYFDIVRRQKN